MASQASPGDVEIDRTTPHSARMYDYVIGGKTHFEVDRATVDMMGDALVGGVNFIRSLAVRNRKFMGRAVRYLAGEARMRQFLDLGAGIPAYDNTHELVQAIDPKSRVVYVDHDPIVLAHAHERRLTSTPEGRCEFVHADFCDADEILESASALLDFNQPVALMLVALLHLVGDERDPDRVVTELLDVLPSGSYVAISHFTTDHFTTEMTSLAETFQGAGETLAPRSYDEIHSFVSDLELVPPGLVLIDDWHPDDEVAEKMPLYGGVARKG